MAEIRINIDDAELWGATFGSSGESMPWYQALTFSDGADWDKPGEATITIGIEDDEPVTRTVTVGDLADALGRVIARPTYHCGERITHASIEDSDACVADAIMQMAVLGEIRYA